MVYDASPELVKLYASPTNERTRIRNIEVRRYEIILTVVGDGNGFTRCKDGERGIRALGSDGFWGVLDLDTVEERGGVVSVVDGKAVGRVFAVEDAGRVVEDLQGFVTRVGEGGGDL